MSESIGAVRCPRSSGRGGRGRRPCPRRGRRTSSASDWKAPSSSSDVGEIGLERLVEEPLRQAQRAGRPGGEAGRELRGDAGELVGSATHRYASPRSTASWPVAPSPSITIALARGSPTRRGSRYAPPASTTSPHLANDHMKRVPVVHEHEVAGEREVGAGADRRAVHRGDRRLVELPQLADERLHADAQRLGRRCASSSRAPPAFATVDAVRSMPGAERVAGPGDEQRADVGIVAARRARRRRSCRASRS